MSTVQRWLSAIGDAAVAEYPPLAVLASWTAVLGGNSTEAERWATIVDAAAFDLVATRRRGVVRLGAGHVRSFMCPAGPEQALADASLAVDQEPVWSRGATRRSALWRGPPAHRGRDGAHDLFMEASALAEATGNADTLAIVEVRARSAGDGCRRVGNRSRSRGAGARHDRRAPDARLPHESARICLCGPVGGAPGRPERGRAPAHPGDAGPAVEHGRHALLRGPLRCSSPRCTVGHRRLLDRPSPAARDRRHHAASTEPRCSRRRRWPSFARRSLSAQPGVAGGTPLTPAELRLLPYLQTHLTFGDIGKRLFVSATRSAHRSAPSTGSSASRHAPMPSRRQPRRSGRRIALPGQLSELGSRASSVSYPRALASLGAAPTTHGSPTMGMTPTSTSTISAAARARRSPRRRPAPRRTDLPRRPRPARPGGPEPGSWNRAPSTRSRDRRRPLREVAVVDRQPAQHFGVVQRRLTPPVSRGARRAHRDPDWWTSPPDDRCGQAAAPH